MSRINSSMRLCGTNVTQIFLFEKPSANITDHLPVHPTTILGLSSGLQPLVQKTF
jgi:hypothetical protein